MPTLLRPDGYVWPDPFDVEILRRRVNELDHSLRWSSHSDEELVELTEEISQISLKLSSKAATDYLCKKKFKRDIDMD